MEVSEMERLAWSPRVPTTNPCMRRLLLPTPSQESCLAKKDQSDIPLPFSEFDFISFYSELSWRHSFGSVALFAAPSINLYLRSVNWWPTSRTAETHWNTLWTQETLRDEQGHFWHCRVWLLDPQLLVRSSDLGDLPSWEPPHCKWI